VRASLAALPVGDKVGPAGDGPVPGKISKVFGRMRIVKSKNCGTNGIGQG